MGTSLEPELQSVLLFGNLYPSFPFNITSKLKSLIIEFVKPIIIPCNAASRLMVIDKD